MGSKKLLKNAMVISRYNTEPFHASVFVEGNRIASVIPKDAGEVEDFSAEEVVDLTGKLLIPGAINAHTHAAMTVHRGLSEHKGVRKMAWKCERPDPNWLWSARSLHVFESFSGTCCGNSSRTGNVRHDTSLRSRGGERAIRYLQYRRDGYLR